MNRKHNAHVVGILSINKKKNGTFFYKCGCGIKGELRQTKKEAEADKERHIKGMQMIFRNSNTDELI